MFENRVVKKQIFPSKISKKIIIGLFFWSWDFFVNSFDAEKAYLSIGGIFRAIRATPVALEQNNGPWYKISIFPLLIQFQKSSV